MTFPDPLETTLYFRRGTQILQTSSHPVGSITPLAIEPSQGIAFASAPAASAGVAFATGANVAIARTTANQIFFIESGSDGLLTN